jgi:hypothetical protein
LYLQLTAQEKSISTQEPVLVGWEHAQIKSFKMSATCTAVKTPKYFHGIEKRQLTFCLVFIVIFIIVNGTRE